MKFYFKHLDEALPPLRNRTERLRKKLKVGEYQEVMFDIVFQHNEPVVIDDDKFDAIADYIYGDIRLEQPLICMSTSETNVMVWSRFSGTEEEREKFAADITKHLIKEMSKYWSVYAEIEVIDIRIGDANYGNW